MKVRFCEDVLVFDIPGRCQEEVNLLFWNEEDYQRMRLEHQIQFTRRARARIRERKRSFRSRAQIPKQDSIVDKELFSLPHATSMRVKPQQISSKGNLPLVIAFAA